MVDLLQWINAGAVAFIGILLAIVAYFLKRSLEGVTDRLDKIDEKMTLNKEDLLRNYATKDIFEKSEQSRKEIWLEINGIRERIAKIGG